MRLTDHQKSIKKNTHTRATSNVKFHEKIIYEEQQQFVIQQKYRVKRK